jgi:hypothetical protein
VSFLVFAVERYEGFILANDMPGRNYYWFTFAPSRRKSQDEARISDGNQSQNVKATGDGVWRYDS